MRISYPMIGIVLAVGCQPADSAAPAAPSSSTQDQTINCKLFEEHRGEVFRLCQQIPDDKEAAWMFIWMTNEDEKLQSQFAALALDAGDNDIEFPEERSIKPFDTHLGFIRSNGQEIEFTISKLTAAAKTQ